MWMINDEYNWAYTVPGCNCYHSMQGTLRVINPVAPYSKKIKHPSLAVAKCFRSNW